jgi:hypothetical protein
MKREKKPSKYEYINELLRNLGLGLIDLKRFWSDMDAQRFTQEDIDRWCDEYHRRENERQETGTARTTTARDA